MSCKLIFKYPTCTATNLFYLCCVRNGDRTLLWDSLVTLKNASFIFIILRSTGDFIFIFVKPYIELRLEMMTSQQYFKRVKNVRLHHTSTCRLVRGIHAP